MSPYERIWTITRPCVPVRCCTSEHFIEDFARVRMYDTRDTDYAYARGRLAGTVVEKIARYFWREFDYDVAPYNTDEHQRAGDTALHPYIFFDRDHYYSDRKYAIGACVFHFRQFSDIGDRWELAWVWFHPYCRRRGYLSAAWPYFTQQYGDFVVQHPLSLAMEAFIRARTPTENQDEYHSRCPSR